MTAPAACLTSNNAEWYTPGPITEAARRVMGTIDLDPASCYQANKIVQAEHYYDKLADGLSIAWKGNVWLNPPYGRLNGHSSQGVWSGALLASYRYGDVQQAILLVNAATDTRWFQPLWSYPICFVRGRIRFSTSTGTPSGPTHGSAMVYLGQRRGRFIAEFARFGPVVYAVKTGE